MTLTIVTSTLGLFAVLLLCYRFCMRLPFLIVVFGGGPVLTLVEARRLDLQVFTWVKLFTLTVSMAILTARSRAAGRSARMLSRFVVGLLALNIIEAVGASAVAGAWANALVGVSLVLTLPSAESVDTRVVRGRQALVYDLPWRWLLAYVAWNLTVVCTHYGPHWFDHIAVLGAPLTAALVSRNRAIWLEARALTLGLYGYLIVIVSDVGKLGWIPSAPSPAGLRDVLTLLSVTLGLWNATAWWRARLVSGSQPTAAVRRRH